MRYSFAVIVLALAILAFGTIYSDLTARDPCAVRQEMTRTEPLHIPRYLHYQSKTSEMTEEIRTWQRGLNIIDTASLEYPGISLADADAWTTVYWSDEACRKLVEEEFPTFADTYHKYFHTIQRVDSCRYLILSKYGGIYADTDVSLHTVNVEELERLIPDGVSLVESPFRYNEMWQNSLMTATIPGHPFWDVVISIMMEITTSQNGWPGIVAVMRLFCHISLYRKGDSTKLTPSGINLSNSSTFTVCKDTSVSA